MAKPKLNAEIHKKIVEFLEKGNYMATAANAIGIPQRTILLWLKKGEDNVHRDKRYRHFYLDVKKAKASAEIDMVDIIVKEAKKNWFAAAWFLERTNYKMWGKKGEIALADKPLEIIKRREILITKIEIIAKRMEADTIRKLDVKAEEVDSDVRKPDAEDRSDA